MRRTLDNCALIKQIGSKPNQYNGKCEGYAKSESDDEPAETCKYCKLNTYYEPEETDYQKDCLRSGY